MTPSPGLAKPSIHLLRREGLPDRKRNVKSHGAILEKSHVHDWGAKWFCYLLLLEMVLIGWFVDVLPKALESLGNS